MQTKSSIYNKIAWKTQAIRDLIVGRQDKQKIEDSITEYRKTSFQLASISSLFRGEPDFGVRLPEVLDPPTSGYSSDCYENEESDVRVHSLSFTEAKNHVLDTSCIELAAENVYPLDDFNVVLLIEDIPSDLTYFTLDKFMVDLKNPPEMLKVRFLFFNSRPSVILQFKRADQAKVFFDNIQRRLPNFIEMFGEKSKVWWAKISAETKVSKLAKENKVVLPLKFFPDNFYAVIVRNLPYETVPKEIEKFLQDKNIRPVRVDGLYVLRNETFGLIVLDSLENSEKACMWLNDRKIKRHKLKAHIHPDSYQRKPAGLSLDELLRSGFKEDESATKKLALLDELLEEAKILAEIRSIRQAEAERRIKQNERAALQHSNQVYSPYGSNKHRPRDNYYGRYDRYDREDKYYRHDRYERHDSGLGREHRRGSRERRVDRKRELSPVAEGRKNRSGSKHRQRSSSGSARSRERRHHQREAGEVTVSKARDGRGEKSSKRKKSPTGNGSLLQRDLAERQNDTEEIWHARGRLGSSDLLPSENGPGAAATSGTRSGHDLGLAREPGGTFLGPSYSERKTTRSTIETRATVGEGLETESPSDRTKTPKTRETGTTAANGGKTRLTEKKSPSFRY